MKLDVDASDTVEVEIWKDPVMVEPSEIGHLNGSLSFRKGGFFGIDNVIPVFIGSNAPSVIGDPNSGLVPIAISQELPNNYFLSVTSPYTASDPETVDVNFSDYRLVKSGRKVASFVCSPGGQSFDLTELFGPQREIISAEYDAPPDFPVNIRSLKVKTFDTNTGLITVNDTFPLRLYDGQRIQKDSTNYYVRSIESSVSFTLKAAKVDTAPVTSGIAADDFLSAFYEVDLSQNVATPLSPVYRSEIVFVVKPFASNNSGLDKSQEYDAEWMNLFNTSSSNTYTVVTSPTVNLHLTNGVS